MKRKIKRKVYNTDTAEELGFSYNGMFGDPHGYEERLYRTRAGEYFLYGRGGCESQYGNESIEIITKRQADSWLDERTQNINE